VDENIAHLFQLGQNSAQNIVKIRPLELGGECPWVYDLTVKDHHCYLANGLLVSNSDALRTMSEAHRLGLLEGASAVDRETRITDRKVLRGPGPQSYSVGQRQPWRGKVLR